jgi:hypothetical protein
VRELAAQYGFRVADQFAAFMGQWEKNSPGGAKLTSDQVHMAAGGDALMARTALLAMGISEKALERARPEVEKQIPQR